jgi:hypothetical protein
MSKWEDNIRMDFRKILWKGVDWMQLTEDRDQWRTLLNMVMNLGVVIKGRKFID